MFSTDVPDFPITSNATLPMKKRVILDFPESETTMTDRDFPASMMARTGPPKRWRGELRALREPSTVQKVAMLAPSSVLTVRGPLTGAGFLLCTDGSAQSAGALRRGAVLAHCCGEPVSILAVAKEESATAALERKVQSFKADLEARGITVDDATVAVGDPVPAIIEAGKSKSVIVVSDSGKSKITRFITGSVAFDVMGKSETSVLTIR